MIITAQKGDAVIRESLKEYCVRTGRAEILAEWDYAKNGALTPGSISRGSDRKVWWRCGRGHEWLARIESRTRGSGCPVCAGKVIVSGENDLAAVYPQIAAQWHPVKNGGLTPWMVAPYSRRQVWWLCPLGHEYKARIARRTGERSGCPYCTGQKVLAGFNDLATVEPQVAAQWHPTLNGSLTPQTVTAQSNKKVWWLCPEGHVWEAAIYSRTGKRKTGCPVCAGRVKRHRAGKKYINSEYNSRKL